MTCRPRFAFALGTLTLTALAVMALNGCGDRTPPAPQPEPPPVEVLAVRAQPVIPRFEYVGRVEAMDEFVVRPRVEGFIQRRYFEQGALVEEGELLYELDPQPFVAALDNQRAAVAQARAALQVSERNFQRGRELVEVGAISRMQMDELTGNYEENQARLQAAQANVEQAELNLSYTRIHSPLTGRIGRSEYTEGALVGPQTQELATVVRLDPVFVLFEVPEERLLQVQMEMGRRLREGASPEQRDIRIKLPDGSYYPERGTIAFVDNQININTGSVAVRAQFPNPDLLLVQGQFARVSIRVYGGPDDVRPLVPQAAVMEDMQGRYVYVVDENNIARRRYLELGQREGALWAVEKGLTAGERVIVNGLQRVVADKPVTPQDTPRNPYQPELDLNGDSPGTAPPPASGDETGK